MVGLPCPGIAKWVRSAIDGAQVMEEIVQRTASAMVDRGIPFSGVLFAGLMIRNGKVRWLLSPQQTCPLTDWSL